MADSKITALTSISTSSDPANDPLVIVDVSDTSMAATGTTKKVTLNQLLATSPTATLASATITGDLTVDTNVLKVDTTNDRVGIGTASPSGILHAANLGTAGTTADNFNGYFSSANRNANLYLLAKNTEGSNFYFGDGDSNTVGGIIYDHASNYMRFDANGSERMRIDSSGNVGVGVTPSAWVAGAKALQFGAYGALAQSSSGNIELSFNSYNSGAGAYKYLQTDTASLYRASSVHSWFIAPSGTAGNVITYTQAMTLDASGVLLVGTTTAPNVGAATTSSGFSINGSGNNAYIASKIDNGTCGYFRRDGTDGAALNFYKANSAVGNISVTASACTFNSTSDYRLKESVQLLTGGLARVSALKPSIYKWKADGSNGEGFIAHELAEVVPAAVSGEKDALNEDGSIKPQGVDMSRVVPILVAAIQELASEVNALKKA